VDAKEGGLSPVWRGYFHHRSICWDGGGQLAIVPKYPFFEELGLPNEDYVHAILGLGPMFWNTYHFWEEKINVVYLSALNVDLQKGYSALLSGACRISVDSTCKLFNKQLLERA
jgi:hypothetical protein